MATRLTETAISRGLREAAQDGKRRDMTDAGQPGLRLRITPSGGASWVLACRDRAGRMRRFALGAYPAMGVAEARTAARVMHHKVRQEGADPTADRRTERARAAAAKDGAGTLAALLDLYERQRGANLKSWPEYRRSIGRVWGAFLARPLADLRLADLQLAADRYEAQAQASLAVRCLRPILKWASVPGRAYVPADLATITAPAPPQRRGRVIDRAEMRRILAVLKADSGPYAAALQLMTLTLLRRSEADGARWRDVDWQAGTLTIDASRSKNRQDHIVPLPRQAVDLLRERMSAGADPDALIFSTSTGRPLGNWDRATKAIHEASETSGWHRHDLRRTGATMLGEMGELPDIIEAALNHTAIHSQLAAVYNRSRYRPQVAAALQRLADALDGIEADAAEIIPFRRGAE